MCFMGECVATHPVIPPSTSLCPPSSLPPLPPTHHSDINEYVLKVAGEDTYIYVWQL